MRRKRFASKSELPPGELSGKSFAGRSELDTGSAGVLLLSELEAGVIRKTHSGETYRCSETLHTIERCI
jgi:hypothetical protein